MFGIRLRPQRTDAHGARNEDGRITCVAWNHARGAMLRRCLNAVHDMGCNALCDNYLRRSGMDEFFLSLLQSKESSKQRARLPVFRAHVHERIIFGTHKRLRRFSVCIALGT